MQLSSSLNGMNETLLRLSDHSLFCRNKQTKAGLRDVMRRNRKVLFFDLSVRAERSEVSEPAVWRSITLSEFRSNSAIDYMSTRAAKSELMACLSFISITMSKTIFSVP